MLVARFLRFLTRFRHIQPQVGRLHSVVLRRSGGRIRRSLLLAGGQPVLALTTTGRRSGRPRSTVVAYLRHDDGYAVTPLNLGSDRHPAWYLNLRSQPRAKITVDGQTITVCAREATGAEAGDLWRAYLKRLPPAAHLRRLAGRQVPMLVLEPGSG
jgi:deazaflavin-dependent oxidoreductase (nitroreductase family)